MFTLLCIVMIWPALVLFFYLTDTDQNRKKALKRHKQQLAKQSKPESGHLRSEPKKASDSAWRRIPSQWEIKRRAGLNRDTEPYYVDWHSELESTDESRERRRREIDAEYGDEAQNWFHKWNEGLID